MTTQVNLDYLRVHPAALDSIARAHYAFHANHGEPKAHFFAGSWRDAECRWCGRSRESVRYGDEAPQCIARPEWADESTESVIRREEALFERVREKAKTIAASIDVATLTGEKLSMMHHTHGVDPSMLEIALMEADKPALSHELHDAYLAAYARHKESGKRGLKREVIVGKTAT